MSRGIDDTIGLRDRIAELEEENRQLQERLCPEIQFPIEWGLTATETRYMRALWSGRLVTKDYLRVAVYGVDGDLKSDSVTTVMMFKLRKKLPEGYEIQTVWGQGWRLIKSASDEVAA